MTPFSTTMRIDPVVIDVIGHYDAHGWHIDDDAYRVQVAPHWTRPILSRQAHHIAGLSPIAFEQAVARLIDAHVVQLQVQQEIAA